MLSTEGLIWILFVIRPTFRSTSSFFSCPQKSQRVHGSIPMHSARSSAALKHTGVRESNSQPSSKHSVKAILMIVKKRVNVTTGYTLVKTRHGRVPTYLQRETDTADWSVPTLLCPFHAVSK